MAPARSTRRPLFWLIGLVAVGSGLAALAYLADTVGEATLRLTGEVIGVAPVLGLLESNAGPDSREPRFVKIAIPGRTFWHRGPYDFRDAVSVRVRDGRFSRWRYIESVAPPGFAEFNEALEKYQATVERLKQEFDIRPASTGADSGR